MNRLCFRFAFGELNIVVKMALSYHFSASKLVIAELPFVYKTKDRSWMKSAQNLGDLFN